MSQDNDLAKDLRASENPHVQQVVDGIDNLPDLAEISFYIGLQAACKDATLRLEISTQIVHILVRNGFDEDPNKHTEQQRPITKAIALAGLLGGIETGVVLLGLVGAYFKSQAEAEDAAVAEIE